MIGAIPATHGAAVGTLPPPDGSAPWRRTRVTLMAVLLLLTWAISHRYGGLFHDALLYTLQSAARLHPSSLSRDIFLAFGSQDHYTVFGPLYAAAARTVGTENAAMGLTLLFQGGLMGAAWGVARSVMPGRLALLGLAVFIAIPGSYGPDRVFHCIEDFITPRMAAEALVLLSLIAALRARQALAVGLLLLAGLLHPLMAGAGAAALLWLRRPHWLLPGAVIAFTATMALLGQLQAFDSEWLELVRTRSPYLFMSHWTWDDAVRCALALATLGLGALYLTERLARELCQTALCVAALGLLLTGTLCDGLHIVLFTQLQPWRWAWLATAISALLLPALLRARFAQGTSGRITVLCLVSAWLFESGDYAAIALVAACASPFAGRRAQPAQLRLLAAGAWGLLIIAATYRLATNLTFAEAYYLEPTLPLWVRRTSSFLHDGSVAVVAIALVDALAHAGSPRRVRGVALAGLAIGCLVAVALVAEPTSKTWRAREFPESLQQRFAPWRAYIPVDSEVFWPESPAGAWLLLERANYLSVAQTSGMVFSRASAMEMRRRARAIDPPLAAQAFLAWSASNSDMTLSLNQQRALCDTHAFDYLVTATNLKRDPLLELRRTPDDAVHVTRLYDCKAPPARTGADDQARAAAAST